MCIIYFVEGTEQQMDNTLHFDNTEESARSVGFIMSCTGSGDSLEFTKKEYKVMLTAAENNVVLDTSTPQPRQGAQSFFHNCVWFKGSSTAAFVAFTVLVLLLARIWLNFIYNTKYRQERNLIEYSHRQK